MSTKKNDGHYFCRVGGNRPDGLNEPVTIIIPPIIFNGIAYSDPGSGNNPGGTRYTGYGFEVRKNGVLIASRETKGAIPGSYSAVIDMPSGRGSVTLEFKIFQKGNQGAGNITDCTVIVTKKAASGISIR